MRKAEADIRECRMVSISREGEGAVVVKRDVVELSGGACGMKARVIMIGNSEMIYSSVPIESKD